MKKQRGSFRHHLGLILALVALIGAATMVTGSVRPTFAETVAPGWSLTGRLNEPRYFHTSTLLPDGKVLVVGGTNFSGGVVHGLDSAELYDPVAGKWNATGRLNVPRTIHTATLLKDGKVLIVGGVDGRDFGSSLNSAELYDPVTGACSNTGSLNTPRFGHTATLLKNGKVLVAGGSEIINWDESRALDTAELYDPDTGTWSLTGSLNIVGEYNSATLLQNGKVLLLGGGSAELYDPDTGMWSRLGSLGNTIGVRHTATLLPDGRVFIVGGVNSDGPLPTTQLYDPNTGTLSSTDHLNRARFDHTATLLPDGKVFVAGGGGHIGSGGITFRVSLDSSEVYDPETETWSFLNNLNTPRIHHTATLLPDGKALLVGGLDGPSIGGLRSVEISHNFTAVTRPKITMATVAGKKLIVVGESFEDGAVILLDGEEQKTRNDEQNPQTRLIGKRAGKSIKAGDKLQVRNPNGSLSAEFTFTGS